MSNVCIICKQNIDSEFMRVDEGLVHIGPCFQYYEQNKIQLKESESEQLFESTELLL